MRSRRMGWALILYGLLGLALLAGGAVIGLQAAVRVERLAAAADGTLAAAARSTRAAADSFTSIDGSLNEAQGSADQAAGLAREAGGTLDALSIAMQVTIFGSQPLSALSSEFATSADQAAELGDTLDAVSASLADTRTDVATIGVELEALSRELESLQGADIAGGGTPPLQLLVALLLAWLAVPAVGAVLFGMALLRPGAPAPPA